MLKFLYLQVHALPDRFHVIILQNVFYNDKCVTNTIIAMIYTMKMHWSVDCFMAVRILLPIFMIGEIVQPSEITNVVSSVCNLCFFTRIQIIDVTAGFNVYGFVPYFFFRWYIDVLRIRNILRLYESLCSYGNKSNCLMFKLLK